VVFSTSAYRLTYAGRFNGSNAFLSRLSNPDFDLSKGDWHLSAHLWPNWTGGIHTLFYTGSDASNFFKVFLEDQGSLRMVLMSDGAEVMSLGTGPGTIHTNGWQKISVQQLFDRWMLRVDNQLVLDASRPVRLKPYGGVVYLGCSRDHLSGTNTDFYAGLMDDFVMSNGTFCRTQATVDLLCEVGGLVNMMSHGETGTPREVWRIMLDALRDYSGRLKVMTLTEAFDYLRAQGVLQPDQRTVLRTSWEGQPDYGLRLDSPCVGAGSNAAVAGVADLTDAAGLPVTDASGQIIVGGGTLSIGAFQPSLQVATWQLPAAMLGEYYSNRIEAVGGVTGYGWGLTQGSAPLPSGIVLSPDGLLSGLATVAGSFSFSVEVADGIGRRAIQVLSLQIQPALTLPRLERPQILSGDACRLVAHGGGCDRLVLEVSTNLVDWDWLGDLWLTDDFGQWDDPLGTNTLQRFYRLRR
jgi:hypothetical protein